jgi:hypothetical protein
MLVLSFFIIVIIFVVAYTDDEFQELMYIHFS